MSITYIVVTEKHNWGRAKSLAEALINASLRQWTATDHFAGGLECDWTGLDRLNSDWDEYAKDECLDQAKEPPVACTIYRWDSDLWDNYNISGIDGGVSFVPIPEDGRTDEQMQKDFDESVIRAYWQNGKLWPRKGGADRS